MEAPPPFADVKPDDKVRTLGEGLPPRGIELDGAWRKRGREIECEDALRLSERSVRRFLVTPSGSSELTADQFRVLVTEYCGLFSVGPGDPVAEAFLHVFGRREGKEDHRILVASVAQWGPPDQGAAPVRGEARRHEVQPGSWLCCATPSAGRP